MSQEFPAKFLINTRMMDSNIAIPPELEMIALRTFDNLVAKGEILYEPPTSSVDCVQGFQVLKQSLYGRHQIPMQQNPCELNTIFHTVPM